MPLEAGRSIGPYDIVGLIGTGGMGEVYRARDRKLHRDIALKVLPEPFATDAERLRRFEREARALAALNHPHIAQIYGVEESNGARALVMELVEGETLAERIARGPIPIDETVAIARQIADALDAAHERGIIHRDLKPANIKLRPDGTAKVLDFGLAKAFDSRIDADGTHSPTMTASGTRAGVILGTAAYMSPEQARGLPVDKRTDIWAFGCVLYEMLTCRAAFAGATLTDTLAAILDRGPSWAELPPALPTSVRQLLEWCLEKDPRRRLRDIADAVPLIPGEGSTLEMRPPARAESRLLRGVAIGAGIASIVAITLVTWILTREPALAPTAPVRFAIELPPAEHLNVDSSQASAVAISADGRLIAYAARRQSGSRIYARRIEGIEATPVPGTEGATDPFISPDGVWIGFAADGFIRKVPVAGGAPQRIAPVSLLFGASWGPNDSIVYADWGRGLFRVSAEGGTPERVASVNEAGGEVTYMVPHVFPAGNAVVFAVRSRDSVTIAILDLASGTRKTLFEGSNPHYSSTGQLLFTRGTTIYTAPFDAERLEVTGPIVATADEVQTDGQSVADFALAAVGTCVLVPPVTDRGRLVWVDSTGRSNPFLDEISRYDHPRISPDGSRVVVRTRSESGSELWVHDIVRKTPFRLSARGTRPIWTSDGKRVVFSQFGSLYSVPADGSSPPQVLLQPDAPSTSLFPLAWSGKGPLVFSRASAETSRDIYTFRAKEDIRAVVTTVRDERAGVLSPDGRWMLYAALEPGREEQVYMQPYPGPGERVIVSQGGGREPIWSPTGKEVFYRSNDGQRMLAVDVQTDPVVTIGPPRTLFEGRYRQGEYWSDYDVSSDGKRFLMVELAEAVRERINVALRCAGVLTPP